MEAEEEPSEETEESSNEEEVAESEEAPIQRRRASLVAVLEEKNDGALTLSGEKTLNGAGAHILSLPPAPSASLALIAARSEGDVAISIERRDADGQWRAIGVERGRAPVAAWPAAGDGEMRAVVWAIGGEDAPITLAARAVERRARRLGEIALDPVDGVAGVLRRQGCNARRGPRDAGDAREYRRRLDGGDIIARGALRTARAASAGTVADGAR